MAKISYFMVMSTLRKCVDKFHIKKMASPNCLDDINVCLLNDFDIIGTFKIVYSEKSNRYIILDLHINTFIGCVEQITTLLHILEEELNEYDNTRCNR